MIQSYSINRVAYKARLILQLSKIRISQLVAISTMLGYVMATGRFSYEMILPIVGTFLLSCGSAALNQVQEHAFDARMYRTRNRPIPSGKMTFSEALGISLFLMVLGSVMLYVGANSMALLLGLFNILWYNGLYTPLKRVSSFAIFPGALIGAIPPMIGWVAGGRGLMEIPILSIAFFFFIWQVPHYWLLLSNLNEDYRRAGYPTLTSHFPKPQFAKITFTWIVATATWGVLLAFFADRHSLPLISLLFISGTWLVWSSRSLLKKRLQDTEFREAFKNINYYMVMVILVMIVDRVTSLYTIG
ncbi:MAG: protoheme IX farnesyltransferase [Calditrichaeota bacterium]|nr:MAG: protoheme IX farnesyltransferase [Calditrichota bacterium]